MFNAIEKPAISTEKNGRYVGIMPMRNELNTVETTIKAVLAQTVLPFAWIILDDGSEDGSEAIVARYAQQYSWICHVKVKDRGYDFVGKGVADLLNHGLNLLAGYEPVEYVAKLDADVDIEVTYFEALLREMNRFPDLGIVSGHPYVLETGSRVYERHSDYFPSGTARLYRASYLNEIGYFASSVGWDTVDILRMRMGGHLTRIYHDIPVHHMRRMGTRRGYIDGMVRDGKNNYLTGYTPLFFVMRAVFNARYYPYLFRTACMIYGYFAALFCGTPRAVTKQEYRFHAHLQWRRLMLRGIDDLR